MNKISISDFQPDQRISDVPLALKEFEIKYSRQDKPYYNVNLGDKTGEIRAKVWTESMENCEKNVKVGDIVLISGLIQDYAGKPQIIIDSMKLCTEMAPDEFLPITSRDRSLMKEYLESEFSTVQNEHLKKLISIFWENPQNIDKFINFPAGEYVHHGYVGGLIEHVYEMMVLSKSYRVLYPQLNSDLLITGILFHDIGKLEELDIVGATIIRNTEGKLIAHVVQGLLIVNSLIQQLDNFPNDLKNKLFHLILSHQGQLEYGSPVKPMTLEAIVLSMIDDDSAKMNMATKHIEKNLESGEEFTEYHKWLQRSLFQGDYLSEVTVDQRS